MPSTKITTPASAIITLINVKYLAPVVKYVEKGGGRKPAIMVNHEFCGGLPFSNINLVDCSTSSIVAKYQNRSYHHMSAIRILISG